MNEAAQGREIFRSRNHGWNFSPFPALGEKQGGLSVLVIKLLRAAALTASFLAASAASAQLYPTGDPTAPAKDSIMIAGGAVYRPTYEGSDDYRIVPAVIVRGRVSGFSFWSRDTHLLVDLIPDSDSLDLQAGVIAGVRTDRTGENKDLQVDALGDRNLAWEIGGFVGISKTGVITSAYDTIGMRVSYEHDIGNAHESYIITPSIDYGTPLSTQTYVSIGASMEIVGDRFASYYYDVTPAGSAASGLPVYHAEGGIKSWGVNLLLAQSLSGDLRKGLAAAVIGSYRRLQNDFAESPVVSVAGSRHQWMGAVGLAYTF